MPRTRAGVWSELHIGPAPEVTVSLSAQVMVLAVLADAIAGRRRGLPERWRRAVQDGMPVSGWEAVRPIGVPSHSVTPDVVVPLSPIGDISVEFHVERLRDMAPDILREDLYRSFGGERIPQHWHDAINHPRRWLDGYAAAVDHVWSTMEPLWRRARAAFDREVERVGTAVVRGGLDVLLNTLSDRIVYSEGTLRISDIQPSAYDLGERDLVLVPTIAGRDAIITNLDNPSVVWVAYPLPGIESFWSRLEEGRRSDELAAMLGEVRANLLAALDRPLTMSRLAEQAGTVPSAITYHCERLAAAGLVVRERRGREVWVSRTRRGDDLLELFAN
ncbi:winged helix-turn-helix domain-containing protein [Thermostaphylospora chromogena]|uniref:winged helix-turn-helix domain-containing protein n=1 Tax=Thermostaphylospora chromogena TaxID=35622 RepID=UPI00104212DA|nr:winged helix-turn-helix domain-containing protein [Thermostaphylospora chromogena]